MKVHAIQTGLVRIKRRQVEPVASGARRRLDTLRDRQWSDWLPIHAWVIEHPGGPIVVDTGETARVRDFNVAELKADVTTFKVTAVKESLVSGVRTKFYEISATSAHISSLAVSRPKSVYRRAVRGW